MTSVPIKAWNISIPLEISLLSSSSQYPPPISNHNSEIYHCRFALFLNFINSKFYRNLAFASGFFSSTYCGFFFLIFIFVVSFWLLTSMSSYMRRSGIIYFVILAVTGIFPFIHSFIHSFNKNLPSVSVLLSLISYWQYLLLSQHLTKIKEPVETYDLGDKWLIIHSNPGSSLHSLDIVFNLLDKVFNLSVLQFSSVQKNYLKIPKHRVTIHKALGTVPSMLYVHSYIRVCYYYQQQSRPQRTVCAQALPSYPTLCDFMDWSPSGSAVHGILQARILEWVAMPFSRGSSWPRKWTRISCIAGRFFTNWATRDAHTSV